MMASLHQTLTMEDSITTPASVLRLDSAHTALDDPFAPWDNANSATHHGVLPIATPMDLGLGITGGDTNVYQQELDYQMDVGLLDNMTTIPFTPSDDIDVFTNFDDPFSFQPDIYHPPPTIPESKPTSATPASTSSKTEKPDNKLLSFKPPISNCALFTSTGQQTWPSMSAEMNGMFFVAEDVFADPSQPAGRPTELTCYRRNLFQITGNIVMSRDIKTVVTESGVQMPIYNIGVTLTAVDSAEGKPTEIISVPWKPAPQTVAATPAFVAEEKVGTNPQKILLDLNTHPELDPAVMSLPISWTRLQFKHATANNGRRKGLQQNYVAHICLTGMLATGEEVKLLEIHSGPIIVRGRSPRNFDTKKEVSVNAKQADFKKLADTSKEVQVKVDPGVSNGNGTFYGQNTVQQPLDLADWKTPVHSSVPVPSPSLPPDDVHLAKKPALTHSNSFSTATKPPVPKAKWRSDSVSALQRAAPIDLAIVESLPHKARSGSSSGPRALNLAGDTSPIIKRRESTNTRSASVDDSKGEKRSIGSPLENADLLYEYFPLSLDDWMPPVDAIYRPHVVHHTVIPPDYKDDLRKSKTKRYFSAED